MKKPIIIIGDSHATSNFKHIKEVHVNSVGSYTINKLIQTNPRFEEFISNGAIVIFVFGELDNRVRIAQQVKKGRDLNEIIEALSEGYIKYVLSYKNIIPVIMSIIPPTLKETDLTRGTNQERSLACKKLNESIKNKCIISSIDLLDVYEKSCDENGMLKENFQDEEGYHLGHNQVVDEAFQNIYNEKWRLL